MLLQKLLGANPSDAANWSLVAAVGGNDVTSINLPSGLQVGDIGILFDTCTQTSSITGVIPSGWTALYNVQQTIGSGSSQHRSCISFRQLTPALSSTVVTGINTSAGSVGKLLLVIRPASLKTTVSNNGLTFGSTVPPTYPSNQTIIPNISASMSFRFAYWRSANASAIAGNSLSPATSYAYDLRTDFGGTVIGVGSWQLQFDIAPGSESPTSTVTYGVDNPSGSYAFMLSGSFNIN